MIRASGDPVRRPGSARQPDPGRPPDPARPSDPVGGAAAEVYVYRDTSAEPDEPATAASEPDEHAAAAYWYDLPGVETGPPAPDVPERTRGPFEPLVSSASPPGAEGTADARAQKLEQIKDLYLTAEAIGEANIDKHFDQLLARQRELIGEYFKNSGPAGSPAGHPGQAETEPGEPGPAGPASAPEGAAAAADQPRVW